GARKEGQALVNDHRTPTDRLAIDDREKRDGVFHSLHRDGHLHDLIHGLAWFYEVRGHNAGVKLTFAGLNRTDFDAADAGRIRFVFGEVHRQDVFKMREPVIAAAETIDK